jgi:hypothetical protein
MTLGAIINAAADVIGGGVSKSRPQRAHRHDCASRRPGPAAPSIQIALIYELLDAHDDTARMAASLESDPAWQAHLEYLRTLQRRGREAVAQLSLEIAP